MGALNHLDRSLATQEFTRSTHNLSLYDRYSSLAYGIILQIIPDPEIAQHVLIDLFSSSQLKSYPEESRQVSSEIIRLARTKALGARPAQLTKPPLIHSSTVNDDMAKLVFDLSFYRGCSVKEIAERLQLSQTNVLSMLYAYFKQQRSS